MSGSLEHHSLCVVAAGQHVRDYEADSAGRLSPQDLVISMLQLLFLVTQQLSSQHRYAISPLNFSERLMERAASVFGLTQEMADEALRFMVPGSLQAAQMGRQEQEMDMQLCLCKPTEALVTLRDLVCLQQAVGKDQYSQEE